MSEDVSRKHNFGKHSNLKLILLAAILIIVVFSAEVVIMFVFYEFPIMSNRSNALLDAFLLVILFLPALYFLVLRPLRESEDKFNTIVASTRDAVIIVDENSKISFWNPAAEYIFGFTAEEAIGELLHKLIIPKRFFQDSKKGFEKFQETGLGPFIGKTVELPGLHKNGKEFFAEHSMSAIRIKGKWYAITIVKDISEKKEAEEHLKTLGDLKNKFIKIVSHQLRTPLNGIRWNLEILIGGQFGAMTKEQSELLKMIYGANTEVIRRIHDVILAIDIKEKRLFLSKTRTNLASLLSSATIDLQKKCLVKELACESHIPEGSLPAVFADAERMRDVMERLMENALNYTPENGRMVIALKKIEDNVRFEIMDTGIGIPEYEQENIFTPFYRASNAFLALPDASGLGLFICKTIIEAHGGKISFESEENKGSLFWFEIPIEMTEHSADVA